MKSNTTKRVVLAIILLSMLSGITAVYASASDDFYEQTYFKFDSIYIQWKFSQYKTNDLYVSQAKAIAELRSMLVANPVFFSPEHYQMNLEKVLRSLDKVYFSLAQREPEKIEQEYEVILKAMTRMLVWSKNSM